MTGGVVDTTVVLHYFRGYGNARSWVDDQQDPLLVTSITWLEVMEGATNKSNQDRSKQILASFSLVYVTAEDQRWAIEQLEKFHFSDHVGMNDCLIAAVARRLDVPLYTHNLKHMRPLIGSLAIKPYL